MNMKELPITIIFVFVILLSGFPLPEASADMYFNSAEPICNASDPTVLLCDDWEDGVWMTSNFDYNGGPTNPNNDGWGGVISYLNQQNPGTNGKGFNPPAVPGYAICGGAGAGGTNCAATSGKRLLPPAIGEPSGYSHAMMGEHDFVNGRTVTEVYIRWYMKFLNDYIPAHEKVMTSRDNGGNCCIVFLDYNVESCETGTQFVMYADRWYCNNQGSPVALTLDHWYYVEVHYRLNSGGANGLYELWVDDCGTDGRGCTGPGTLRARHTNVTYRSGSATIGNVWIENYAGAPSFGTSYYDQLIARTQRIGPMSMGTAIALPSAPQNLRVLQ